MHRRHAMGLLAGGLLSASCAPALEDSGSDGLTSQLDPERPEGARAFDFLWGNWQVTNEVLRQRLSGSDSWDSWSARMTVWPLLRGYGNVDLFQAERDGVPFEGSTVRLFDRATGDWSLYWMDSLGLRLLPQVSGPMTPEGEFYGEEAFEDRRVRLRFTWRVADNDHASWEQAYAELGSDQWETNWRMEFTRIGSA